MALDGLPVWVDRLGCVGYAEAFGMVFQHFTASSTLEDMDMMMCFYAWLGKGMRRRLYTIILRL
jgi:hypothetical protein